jgi:hypothetical protein
MLTAVCSFLALQVPVCAAAKPDLEKMLTESKGYFNVRPGLIVIEGDGEKSQLCRIDVKDAEFETYLQNGKLEPSEERVICIPIEEL